jgi:predicted Zn finger-like uncharacterized protein
MTSAITCPKCGAAYRLGPEYAGKNVKCARCRQAFQVPAPTPAPAPPPAPPTGVAGAPGTAARPTPASSGTAPADGTIWTRTEHVVPPGRIRAGTRVFEFRRGDQLVRVPACIGGRYQIDGMLAAGGMGAILKARDERLGGRPVLVKMGLLNHATLFPSPWHQYTEQRQRLEDEMINLLDLVGEVDDRIPAVCHFLHDYSAQLHGPHGDTGWYWEKDDRPRESHELIDVPDVLDHEPYLVLRYIAGTNLRDLLAARSPDLGAPGSLERARVCYGLARELCGLLMQFHRRQKADEEDEDNETGNGAEQYYVYQDLNPANIVRTPMGDHFLIDFGTVRKVIVKAGRHELIAPCADCTRGYAAPEIYQDDVSELSDLYTLGATLYHVVTGEQPRANDLRPAVAAARQQLPAKTFGGLLEVIDRCIRPDPQERLAAIWELADRDANRARMLPVEVLRLYVIRQGKGIEA